MAAKLIEGAAIIGQSGGPTAVINQSLVGVIEGLRGYKAVKKVYGMRHGVDGLIKGLPLVDLSTVSSEVLDRISKTPSAALGSSRAKPTDADCVKIFDACKAADIRYFFYIGGNDSSDTCRIVYEMGVSSGYELRCFHVPKTVDNDLVGNDHTPGYGSAARYVAMAFMADDRDNASLPGIKINVVMGRNAGFLTAASALARYKDGVGPHLIYLPEVDFDEQRFVADVVAVNERLGRCLVAVSEGVHDQAGVTVAEKLAERQERDAHGNVQLSGSGALGDHLAHLVRVALPKARVRADTFGYLQRSFAGCVSAVDAAEARLVGQQAVRYAMANDSGTVVLQRRPGARYAVSTKLVALSEVAKRTKSLPREWISAAGNDVKPAFCRYAAPLAGPLPAIGRLTGR